MATFDLPKMGEVQSIVTRITSAIGFPVGFIYGATAQNPVAGFSTADFEQRIVDTLAEVSGFHMTLGGHTSSYSQTFKPTGFLNKGLWGYLAIWAYDELGLPYAKLIKSVLGNFLIGYSVGGIFDPPIPQPGNGYFTGPMNFVGSGGFATQSSGLGASQPYGRLEASGSQNSNQVYSTGGAVI